MRLRWARAAGAPPGGTPRPLAVLITWVGAQDRHVDTYVKLLHGCGGGGGGRGARRHAGGRRPRAARRCRHAAPCAARSRRARPRRRPRRPPAARRCRRAAPRRPAPFGARRRRTRPRHRARRPLRPVRSGWDALVASPATLSLWFPGWASANARAVLCALRGELAAGGERPLVFFCFSGAIKVGARGGGTRGTLWPLAAFREAMPLSTGSRHPQPQEPTPPLSPVHALPNPPTPPPVGVLQNAAAHGGPRRRGAGVRTCATLRRRPGV
jgi:hypothetical protein